MNYSSNYKEKIRIAPTKISGLRFIYNECEPPEELLYENMAYIYGYLNYDMANS